MTEPKYTFSADATPSKETKDSWEKFDWSAISTSMIDQLDESLFKAIEDMRYQGFDADELLAELKYRAMHKGISQVDFTRDMVTICLLVALRGTAINSNKFLGKTKTEVRDKLSVLFSRYGINGNLSAVSGETGSRAVTMGRISILFSEYVAAAYRSGFAKPVVTQEGLKPEFSFPQGPSLMTSEEWEKNKDNWLKWSVKFAKAVNKNKKTDDPNSTRGKTDQEIMDAQEVFALNAVNSDFNIKNHDVRITNMISLSNRLITLKKGKDK